MIGEKQTTTTKHIRTMDDFLDKHELPYQISKQQQTKIKEIVDSFKRKESLTKDYIESVIGKSDVEMNHSTEYKNTIENTTDSIDSPPLFGPVLMRVSGLHA